MTTKREKILQKLNPKFLKVTPKLSGHVGSFIDLNSDDFLMSGAKELMIRFLKNQDLCEKNRRDSDQKETEFTISEGCNEKDEICELISERLSLPFGNKNEEVACKKPGRRLQKLKMELQEKMSAKWEEEYKKRIKENEVYNVSKHKHVKNQTEDDEKSDKNEEEYKEEDCGSPTLSQEETCLSREEEEELEDDCDEANVEFDDSEEEDNSYAASVADDKNKNNFEANQDNNLEKDDDYESCSLVPAYQPGGGMLYGGSELTQNDEELPKTLLSPSLRLSISESESKIYEFQGINEPTLTKLGHVLAEESENLLTVKTKLFSQNPNDSFDLNDAFEFCSGKFPDAEDKAEAEIEIQNLNKVITHEENNDDNDIDDVDDYYGDNFENSEEDEGRKPESGTEKLTLKSRKNIIVFDDSEEEEETAEEPGEVEESQSAPWKILSDDEDEVSKKQKHKKIQKNLHFSDEEDNSNDCKGEEHIQDEDNDTLDEELEEEEDDQRSVHYDSEENEINPKEFFEKEAELSGSEWSGDEDERDLDEFDVEEGDADVLDNDQVRSQLEKIHIRRVLDDDAREVRLIQEILFEDGDLHSNGKGRDRKFKWKNLGAFEEINEEGTKDEDGNDSDDDGAEEEELRKMRIEKELFLMTKKKNGDLSSDDEIVEDFHSVKVTTVKTSVKKTHKGENKMGNSGAIANMTEIAKIANLSNKRGSFLTRNEEFLSKLARATSGFTDNVLGAKNSKNFVFMTKSPEKGDSEWNVVNKRQIEESESCSRREKKIKLLSPEIDTGPSIVDLLV